MANWHRMIGWTLLLTACRAAPSSPAESAAATPTGAAPHASAAAPRPERDPAALEAGLSELDRRHAGDPDSFERHAEACELLYRAADWKRAMSTCGRAAELSAGSEPLWAAARASKAACTTVETLASLSRRLTAGGRDAAALSCLRELLPALERVRLQAAKAHYVASAPEEAARRLEALLQVAPDQVEALFYLGAILYDSPSPAAQGRIRAAWGRFLELAPADDRRRAGVQSGLSQLGKSSVAALPSAHGAPAAVAGPHAGEGATLRGLLTGPARPEGAVDPALAGALAETAEQMLSTGQIASACSLWERLGAVDDATTAARRSVCALLEQPATQPSAAPPPAQRAEWQRIAARLGAAGLSAQSARLLGVLGGTAEAR